MKTDGLKRTLQKLCWIATAICLVIGACIGLAKPTVRAAEKQNAVPNANFASTDLSYTSLRWSSGSGTSTVDTTENATEDGTYALKITSTSTASTVVRIKLSLTVGKTYTYSAMMKITDMQAGSGGGCGAYMNLGTSEDNYSNQIGWGNDIAMPASREWGLRTGSSFTAIQETYYINIRLWGATGTLWVDDIKVETEKTPEQPDNPGATATTTLPANNVFANARFDTVSVSPTFTWGNNGTFSYGIDTTANAPGSSGYALKLVNETEGANQVVRFAIPMEVGATYEFYAYMKVQDLVPNSSGDCGAFVNLGVSADNFSNKIGWGNDVSTPYSKNWDKRVGNSFVAEASTYYLNIRIWGAKGSLWIDDIVINKTANAPTEIPDVETDVAGLVDGKFADTNVSANWKDGWTNGATYAYNVVSHTTDGTGSLKITTSSPTYRVTKINLVESRKYRISCWIKTENFSVGNVAGNSGAYIEMDAFGVRFGYIPSSTAVSNNDWTYYETIWTSPETITGANLAVKVWAGSGSVFFDEIKLEVVEEIDSEIVKHWTDVDFPTGDGGFTLAAIGDTQNVVYNSPENYTAAFNKIVSLKDEWEIKYLVDLGDMVETYTSDAEWKRVVDTHDLLQTAGLKYAIAVGNHEATAAHKSTPNGQGAVANYVERDFTKFENNFPLSKYTEWLGTTNFGSYDDTMRNTFHKFTNGEDKYLILCIEYGPTEQLMEWAVTVAAANPDHHVIFATHSLVSEDADFGGDVDTWMPIFDFKDALSQQQVWDNYLSKIPNLFLALSGHISGHGVDTLITYGENGNKVTALRIDPQTRFPRNVMGGFLRINGTDVDVYYYCPDRDDFYNGSNFTVDAPQAEKTESGPAVKKTVGFTGTLFTNTQLDGSTVTYSYASTNPQVAKVSANGTVTALKAGTTTITCTIDTHQSAYATYGCKTKIEIPLTVTEPVTPPPSVVPSVVPSVAPSVVPSVTPSVAPSVVPSVVPSVAPSVVPSVVPSVTPSVVPSVTPSVEPSVTPSVVPSVAPSVVPSVVPSVAPSVIPSVAPSVIPSVAPSVIPSVVPSVAPSVVPSVAPSVVPSVVPSAVPSVVPSVIPTVAPSVAPSVVPTTEPTVQPTVVPTQKPSVTPTVAPTTAKKKGCKRATAQTLAFLASVMALATVMLFGKKR